MSSSLIKLIDISLIPASLMVVSKMIGVFLFINLFHATWGVQEYTNSILNFRTAIPAAEILPVSSGSDLLLLFVISAGLGWQIFTAIYLHKSHIHPKLLMQLAKRNLMSLVQGSFDIYHQASIWVIFHWLTSFTILVNAVLNKTAGWVAVIAIISSILFTILLLRDVYHEIEIHIKNLGKHKVF